MTYSPHHVINLFTFSSIYLFEPSLHFLVINHSFLIPGCREDSVPRQKSKDTPPDVIRYSSTTGDDLNEMGDFEPPAKFGSWGQLLNSSSKRQYSSMQQDNSALPPSSSAATSTLPRVARQRRQQQLYRGGRHPAGLSSESSAASESSESSDEEDEDEDEDANEDHSDATTYTGSEMALASNRNDHQKDKSKQLSI